MTSLSNSRILIVGFGNMGRALVRGWLDAGVAASAVCVVDESDNARAEARAWGLQPLDSAAPADLSAIDVVVLAVKPQQIDAALQQFAPALSSQALILSIAAGRTLASLQEHAGAGRAIVRSMPNTPAAISRGTTVLCANAAVTKLQREVCAGLLSAVGAAFWIEDEQLFDAVTAVSGSGPAYVFLLIECLAAAGVRQGLPEGLATQLAQHTVAGAGQYALESQTPAATLREQVTSPGGTTAAALGVFLRDDALRKLVDEAVGAAAARSKELSSD